MNKNSLKERTIIGMGWSFVERFGFLLIQFITNVIIARILTPDDYGIVGILMIIVALAMAVVDCGLGAGLIQKSNITNKDCSTIFYSNIALGVSVYIALFLFAGAIGNYFNSSQLKPLIQVISIMVIFDAVSIIQNSLIIKNLNFKKLTNIRVSSAFIASITAIICAYMGLGVWSLVIQYVTNSFCRCLLLWITSKWYPELTFSKQSFFNLFGYGSKLMFANLLSELYRNFQVIIVCKYCPKQELGCYTQARQLEQVPVMTLANIVNQVAFPAFAAIKDQPEKLRTSARKIIKILSFINFYLMMLLTLVAEPIFIILYSEKWLGAVLYFQFFCMGFGYLRVIHSTNLNIMKSTGKSDMVLILEIIKKITGATLIIIGFHTFGVLGLLGAIAINSILELFFNGFVNGRIINYGIIMQFKDLSPYLLSTLLPGAIIYYLFEKVELSLWGALIIPALCFSLCYGLIAWLFKLEAYTLLHQIAEDKLGKKVMRFLPIKK